MEPPITLPLPPVLGLQFCSDLHLEFNQNMAPIDFAQILQPRAPFLALLGDIGSPLEAEYDNFLAYCSPLFRLVFVVAGNHEYYNDLGVDKEKVDARLVALCTRYPNIVLLQNSAYVLQLPKTTYRMIGTTLWSHITDQQQEAVAHYIGDYQWIRSEGKPLTPAVANAWHAEAIGAISQELATAQRLGQVPVVLTHHVPLLDGTSHRRHDGKSTNCAFASDLSSLFMRSPPIRYWLCGHTHYNFAIQRHDTIVASNQLGYGLFKGYPPQKGFRPDKWVPL